ncbi:MAG TPA: hypothetical protein VHA82_07070 [Ramlibacter sp.]|uniref:hypothetical protein n=1 Tax=Ramlibacter sp. TaxID=1917967 RepID=UPI002CA8309F|nr:hypothetical protein [Ramlibacter sp.]HVZ43554.1 hypothetical protein [Ramlibacter sp.]
MPAADPLPSVEERARSMGLHKAFAAFPASVEAAASRAASAARVLEDIVTPTTEPAHVFQPVRGDT